MVPSWETHSHFQVEVEVEVEVKVEVKCIIYLDIDQEGSLEVTIIKEIKINEYLVADISVLEIVDDIFQGIIG